MSFVDVIGVVSGILTIFSFGQSVFPGSPGSPKVAYRVQLGVAGTQGPDGPLEQDANAVPSYVFYDSTGAKLNGGECICGDDCLVDQGGFEDMTCEQSSERQAVSVDLRAEYEPQDMCIAYVTTTLHDDQKFGWVGNWAQVCGSQWYYSGVLVEGNPEYLECAWLAFDSTDPRIPDVIGIDWIGFAGDIAEGEDPLTKCGPGGMMAWYHTDEQKLPWSWDDSKRSMPTSTKKAARTDERLVITKQAQHDAYHLCKSPGSLGPDLVNLSQGKHGVYCDMDTGITQPVCGEGVEEECFDLTAATHVKRDGDHMVKNVTGIIEW